MKPMKKFSKGLIFILVLIGFSCVTLLCIPIGPLIAIGMEDVLVKHDIDNPYVDREFSGWQTASIDGLDSFRIPEEWTLKQESENVYCIYNESGQVWARGTFTAPDYYIEPLEKLLSMPVTEITVEPFIPIFMMDGSDVNQIAVHSGDITKYYQEIQLFITMESSFTWILEHDISIDEQQFDIAEAMLYSYAFQK